MIHGYHGGSSDGDDYLLPCEITLLQAAWDLKTTSTSTLASHLCISDNTVRTYFERAMRSLAVHDRAGAVIAAAEYGLIRVFLPKLP